MIEIIIVWQLCKKVGEIVREKGRKAFGWQFLTVVLWLGGEIFGAIVGAVMSGGEEGAGLYFMALIGAATGGVTAYAIAKLLPGVNEGYEETQGPITCSSCGESIADYVRACPMCGEPVS